MKIDFHVHTNASVDSSIDVRDLLMKAKKVGIIPAITNHNKLVFPKRTFPYIPGEEIMTEDGEVIGLFLNEEIKSKLSLGETLDKIREQGALSVAPHPFSPLRHGIGMHSKGVDIIEVFNGRQHPDTDELAERFAKEWKKPIVGGSDAHFLFEFGRCYTEIPDMELEPKKILRALKKPKIHRYKTNFARLQAAKLAFKMKQVSRGQNPFYPASQTKQKIFKKRARK
ncbi:PHP domain-containing protein [Candidatus Micrarchaeota archaeon]|nr:PHP domain-containing protein [Candidatus Micrarchaeota archaeon]